MWSFTLAPQVYATMDYSYIDDYVEVKAAILRRYAIAEETYRQKFRTIRKSGNETYVELMVMLRNLANKWMRDCKSVEAVIEKLVVEQFMDGLPPQLHVWMLERRLTSMEEVGFAADDYVGARRYGVVTRGHAQTSRDNPSRWYQDGDAEGSSAGNERRAGGESIQKCYGCGGVGHYKRECPRLTRNRSEMGGPGSRSGIGGQVKTSPVNQNSEGSRVVKCFSCGERGHISTRCPAKPALLCRSLSMNKKLYKVGMVEGVCVEGIFLDTGCGQTLVRKGLVPKEKLLSETVELGCVHGDKVSYPLAMVNMELDGKKFQVKAGVADNLPVPVLMGTDVEVI